MNHSLNLHFGNRPAIVRSTSVESPSFSNKTASASGLHFGSMGLAKDVVTFRGATPTASIFDTTDGIPDHYKVTRGQVTEKDLDDCGRLIGNIEQHEFKNSYTCESEREYMAGYCNQPRSHAIVVRDPSLHEHDNHPDGDVIATGTIGPEGGNADSKTSYIPTLYVDARYRRREHLGEKIILELIAKAKEFGYTEAKLMTSKEIAPRLYEKVGFRTNNPTDRMKHYKLVF